jgi:hypothetical protein
MLCRVTCQISGLKISISISSIPILSQKHILDHTASTQPIKKSRQAGLLTRHPRQTQKNRERGETHGRMARGSPGLPKVSPRPNMPNPSMPCKRATPEMALQQFQGCPTLYLFGHPTPYGYGRNEGNPRVKSEMGQTSAKSFKIRGVRRVLSKRVVDGRRPPSLRTGHPGNGHEANSGVANLQSIVGSGMLGPSDTLGSPCTSPLAIRLCSKRFEMNLYSVSRVLTSPTIYALRVAIP